MLLISREAFEKELALNEYGDTDLIPAKYIRQALDSTPITSVDLVPTINRIIEMMPDIITLAINNADKFMPSLREGSWITVLDNYKCSNCGEFEGHIYRFCPHCGAFMKGDTP